MKITNNYRTRTNTKRVFEVVDELLGRWKRKDFPYNQKRAVIPQVLIAQELRADKKTLACFYFYICIYMRGGIESTQAFVAMERLWKDYPGLFNPEKAARWKHADLQPLLKEYVGWDSQTAAKHWIENSKRLLRNWNGDPLNILIGLRDYDELLRRVTNKRSKKKQQDSRTLFCNGEGFLGFQPKMASMLLYFYDWENWLEVRFLYPTPADFHNFRIGIATEGIVILTNHKAVRTNETLAAPWRLVIMQYLAKRKADPVEVADALWLFSLVLCGRSPVTQMSAEETAYFEIKESTKETARRLKSEQTHAKNPLLFDDLAIPHFEEGARRSFSKKFLRSFQATCGVCPLLSLCKHSPPAKLYYRKGALYLKKRPQGEVLLQGLHLPEPPAFNDRYKSEITTGDLFSLRDLKK